MDLQGPRGLGGGQKGPKESRGRPVASQGVDGLAYRVPGGQGAGLHGPRGSKVDLHSPKGSRGRPNGFQGVKAWAYRVQGGQGVGLHGPRGSRGRLIGSQRVKGEG